jgi:hypothetical protein
MQYAPVTTGYPSTRLNSAETPSRGIWDAFDVQNTRSHTITCPSLYTFFRCHNFRGHIQPVIVSLCAASSCLGVLRAPVNSHHRFISAGSGRLGREPQGKFRYVLLLYLFSQVLTAFHAFSHAQICPAH